MKLITIFIILFVFQFRVTMICVLLQVYDISGVRSEIEKHRNSSDINRSGIQNVISDPDPDKRYFINSVPFSHFSMYIATRKASIRNFNRFSSFLFPVVLSIIKQHATS